MYRGEKMALRYRIVLMMFCLYALLAHAGILQGLFYRQIFAYFTILSVLLTLVFYMALVLTSPQGRWGKVLIHCKGGVIMAVTMTMTVYHFVLLPVLFEMGGYEPFSFNDIVVHYLIPCMVILDWFVFDGKPAYRVTDPLRWLIIPLLYFIFVVLRANLGGPLLGTESYYPYFFIDIDILGMSRVLLNVLIMACGFLLLGYVLFLVDRVLGLRGRS